MRPQLHIAILDGIWNEISCVAFYQKPLITIVNYAKQVLTLHKNQENIRLALKC